MDIFSTTEIIGMQRSKTEQKAVSVLLVFCYDDLEKSFSVSNSKLFTPPVPERDGYVFEGWFKDTLKSVPYTATILPEDTVLFAKWAKINVELEQKKCVPKCFYNITLDFGFDNIIETISHPANTPFVYNIPERESRYGFIGWCTDAQKTNLYNDEPITDDITLYAEWVDTEGDEED